MAEVATSLLFDGVFINVYDLILAMTIGSSGDPQIFGLRTGSGAYLTTTINHGGHVKK